jgi:hypothetical protein
MRAVVLIRRRRPTIEKLLTGAQRPLCLFEARRPASVPVALLTCRLLQPVGAGVWTFSNHLEPKEGSQVAGQSGLPVKETADAGDDTSADEEEEDKAYELNQMQGMRGSCVARRCRVLLIAAGLAVAIILHAIRLQGGRAHVDEICDVAAKVKHSPGSAKYSARTTHSLGSTWIESGRKMGRFTRGIIGALSLLV